MLALDTKGRAAPYLLLAAAATVSVSGALLWSLWRRFRRPRDEGRASSGDGGNEAVPSHVPPAQPISPHRADTHEHGHHHHHHHRSSSSKPSRSTRSSTKRAPTALHAGHGETERLLPSRAATQPVYSSHSHTHPHHSHTDSSAHHEHSSQILQFHVTHDEPLPIDQYQEESPTRERRMRGSANPTLSPGASGHHGRDSYHHGGSIHRAVTDSAVVDDFSRRLHQNSLNILSGVELGGPVDAVYDGPGKHYRELARDALRMRKVALENSQRSFRSGRKAEARQLSEEGRQHEDRARQYNAQAAAEIFQCYNPRYYSTSSTSPQFSRCDLHGLHVEEALQYARDHLNRCRQARVEKTMLIVGKGSHSQAGGARIKPAIMQMMANTGGVIAALHEKNEGCIVVEFSRGY